MTPSNQPHRQHKLPPYLPSCPDQEHTRCPPNDRTRGKGRSPNRPSVPRVVGSRYHPTPTINKSWTPLEEQPSFTGRHKKRGLSFPAKPKDGGLGPSGRSLGLPFLTSTALCNCTRHMLIWFSEGEYCPGLGVDPPLFPKKNHFKMTL